MSFDPKIPGYYMHKQKMIIERHGVDFWNPDGPRQFRAHSCPEPNPIVALLDAIEEGERKQKRSDSWPNSSIGPAVSRPLETTKEEPLLSSEESEEQGCCSRLWACLCCCFCNPDDE